MNLPDEKHSHGLRGLAAVEASRDSFDGAVDAIARATGQQLGKRQVEALARRAATDFAGFYADRAPPAADPTDVLVVSADGKGIVMRPEGLREATAKAAAEEQQKLKTRLSKGEKRNRKRMATVASVYDAEPAPRTPRDVLARSSDDAYEPAPGPVATGKWLDASVEVDAASVIADPFDEAERRDPAHARTWVGLVDGNAHQIDRLTAEATKRGIDLSILVDFIHVAPQAPLTTIHSRGPGTTACASATYRAVTPAPGTLLPKTAPPIHAETTLLVHAANSVSVFHADVGAILQDRLGMGFRRPLRTTPFHPHQRETG